MKSVFPIFFILLNLFFILYLPRKLSIWVRLALYLSIGGLFYLWMSNKSALTSLFAHTLSLQPFDVFHETIGFSLLVTIFLNLFDLLAVPSIVRFPNLILKIPNTTISLSNGILPILPFSNAFSTISTLSAVASYFMAYGMKPSDNQSKKQRDIIKMSLCLYSDGLEYLQNSILSFSRKMLNLKSALTIRSETVSGFGQIF